MPNIKKIEKSNLSLRVDWALLCKNVAVDKTSNQISLFNEVDELSLVKNQSVESAIRDNKKIMIKVELALVVQFTRKEADSTVGYSAFMQIQIVDPLKNELGKITMPLEMQQGKKRSRAIINFNDIAVTKPGDYSFIVSLRYPNETSFSEVACVPLEVNIV